MACLDQTLYRPACVSLKDSVRFPHRRLRSGVVENLMHKSLRSYVAAWLSCAIRLDLSHMHCPRCCSYAQNSMLARNSIWRPKPLVSFVTAAREKLPLVTEACVEPVVEPKTG